VLELVREAARKKTKKHRENKSFAKKKSFSMMNVCFPLKL
jgi:hypothetical protein